jgi:O-acetylserine/cysteine efflux transporter
MSLKHILLAIAVAAIWGFNFVVIHWGLGDMPPLLLSAMRFLVAALPAVFFVKRPQISWGALAVITFFHVSQFNLLFLGMNAGLPAGIASIVIQVQAFFTVLLAAVLLGEKPGGRQIAGMALAFAGMVVIALSKGGSGTLVGLALTIAGGLSWAITNILIKRAGSIDMIALFIWVAALGTVPMFAVSYLVEGPDQIWSALTNLSMSGGLSIVFMAYGATIFGFGVWAILLHHYQAARVASFSLLVPVFGMGAAALLLGEEFTSDRLLAAVLVLAGLYLVVIKKKRSLTPRSTS